MTTERIILVGTVWAVLLLALLVLREFLRAFRTRSERRIMPVLDRLVVVMIIAFAVAAVVRLGSIISPPDASANPSSPAPSSLTADASASPAPGASPSASLIVASPTAAPLSTPTARPTRTPESSPTPKPTSTPKATPTPSPTPTPTPTVPPTPTATPTPTPTAAIGAGQVAITRTTFRAYDVRDGQVTSFHDVTVSSPFTARSTAPAVYGFATFSDPTGSIRLVQMVGGAFAGTYVSPQDPGVTYTPGG